MVRKLLALIVLAILLYAFVLGEGVPFSGTAELQKNAAQQVENAFASRRSNVQVTGEGFVSRVLSDDNEGSRHQRFIVELPSGQTVLISHNIDLAPPINTLQKGDSVTFHGEYEWNPQGGLVHWTHHDPAGRHTGGWIMHKGQRYE